MARQRKREDGKHSRFFINVEGRKLEIVETDRYLGKADSGAETIYRVFEERKEPNSITIRDKTALRPIDGNYNDREDEVE